MIKYILLLCLFLGYSAASTSVSYEPRNLEQSRKRIAELAAEQVKLLEGKTKNRSQQQSQPLEQSQSLEELEVAREKIRKQEAEVEKRLAQYSDRPRKVFVSGRRAGRYQAYVDSCMDKILAASRNGFPKSLEADASKSLQLTVAITAAGILDSVDIGRSSGDKDLDDAVVNIVRTAAPFPAASQRIRDFDVIVISNTFEYRKY